MSLVARFCTHCGASVGPERASSTTPPVPGRATPSHKSPAPVRAAATEPEALAQYGSLLAGFVSDGVIDEGESEVLAGFRQQLRVTQADHDLLLRRHRVFVGMPLRMEFDPATYLRAGSPTTLSFGVTNICEAATALAREVQISYRCSTSGRVQHLNLRTVSPGRRRDSVFEIDAPPSAGQYHLDGTLEATFLDGRVFRGLFHLPALRASAAIADSGPKNVQIQVTGDAANVKMGPGLAAAMAPDRAGEIRSPTRNWREMSLRVATGDDLGQWRMDHNREGGAAAVRRVPDVLGKSLPCRGVVLRIKRQTARDTENNVRDLLLIRGHIVSLGRDEHRADVRVAVEPFDPPGQYPENVDLSMRISSLHLELRLGDREVLATDLDSSNGTEVDGEQLKGRRPTPLRSGTEIRLADAISLRAELLLDDDHLLHGLWLHRLDNLPARSYALAPSGLGLWPSDDRLVGPLTRQRRRAPLAVDWHMGGPCVRNLGLQGLTLLPFGPGEPRRVAVGERRALDLGDRLQLGDGWVIFVADMLQERPGGA